MADSRKADGSSSEKGGSDEMADDLKLLSSLGATAGMLSVFDGKDFKTAIFGDAKLNSSFRIASCSKIITAAGVFEAISNGNLSLDDRIVDFFDDEEVDSEAQEITIANLLSHSSGWDRSQMGGRYPLNRHNVEAIIDHYGLSPQNIRPEHLFQYFARRPLDFTPGTRQAYSSLSYALLAQILSLAVGESYEDFITRNVLKDLSSQMALGETSLEKRNLELNEVIYNSVGLVKSFYSDDFVAMPYGTVLLELAAGSSSWISSSESFLRFLVQAYENPNYSRLWEVPEEIAAGPNFELYSHGALVTEIAGRPAYACEGIMAGSTAYGVILKDGSAAAMFVVNGDRNYSRLQQKVRSEIEYILEQRVQPQVQVARP